MQVDNRVSWYSEHDTPPPLTECPLHIAVRQLAEAAVQQHVLHAAGEVLPRPELVAAMEGWIALVQVIQQRVCPASRPAAPRLEVMKVTFDALFAALPASALSPLLQAKLRRALILCATQSRAAGCPLVCAPQGVLLGQDDQG